MVNKNKVTVGEQNARHKGGHGLSTLAVVIVGKHTSNPTFNCNVEFFFLESTNT